MSRDRVLDSAVVQRHPEAEATLDAWAADDNVWVRRTAELARGVPAPVALEPQP